MKVLGNNYLSINDQTGLSFYIDISTNNTSGSCNFGFTGENFINFRLNDGKLFDHENRNSFTYGQNEIFNISGQINNGNYAYYINNQPACFDGKSNLNKISGFYINAINCSPEINLKIYGKKPNYNLSINNLYYIISGNSLRGGISTNNNFRIYSGIVLAPTGFFIENISNNITSSLAGSILINAYNQTRSQVESERVYPLELRLFTNFGEITKVFDITGSYSGYLNVDLNFLGLNYGSETGLGLYRNDNILVNINVESGDLRSNPTFFNKYVDVEFNYYGGNTGNFNYNVFGSGYKFINASGFIMGSGYLGRTDLNLSGYDLFSGLQATGYNSGSISELFSVTGIVTRDITSSVTGYHFNGNSIGFTSIVGATVRLTGFSYDGIINYNNYVYPINDIYSNINSIQAPGVSLDQIHSKIHSNESGTLVLLSAPSSVNTLNLVNISTGKVAVFTGQNGFLRFARTYSGLSYDDRFGNNIYVDRTGNSFMIGASRIGAQNSTGRFYVFNNYTQAVSSARTIEVTGSIFNIRGVLAGDTVYVGRPTNFNLTGAVEIYKDNNTSFVLTGVLTGYSSAGRFGDCLAVTQNNQLFAASAPYANSSGEIYIFSNQNNNYSLLSKLQRSGQFSVGPDGFGGGSIDCLSFNKSGDVFAAGGWAANNGPLAPSGITYIFTGNANTDYKQVHYINGPENSQFGAKIKLNNLGNTLMATAFLTDMAYIYTGTRNDWKLIRTRNAGGDQWHDLFNLIDKDGFLQASDPGTVQTYLKINHSGYFSGSLFATGIINKSATYLITGEITGRNYKKTFSNSFLIETGYYISGVVTGINSLNLISNESYRSYNAFFNKDINTIDISIKSKNYPPTNQYLTGLLKIVGRTIDNSKSGVIYQYITGG